MRKTVTIQDEKPNPAYIEELQRRRAGPARDPHAVIYHDVVGIARDMLFRELKDSCRYFPVLRDFENRIARLEKCAKNCKTFGEQIDAIEREMEASNSLDLDLRKCRKRKGPDNDTLLDPKPA